MLQCQGAGGCLDRGDEAANEAQQDAHKGSQPTRCACVRVSGVRYEMCMHMEEEVVGRGEARASDLVGSTFP